MILDYIAFFQNLDDIHNVNIAIGISIFTLAVVLYCFITMYRIFNNHITVKIYNLTEPSYNLTHTAAIETWLTANSNVVKTNKTGLTTLLKKLLTTVDERWISFPTPMYNSFIWVVVGNKKTWVLDVSGVDRKSMEKIVKEVLSIQ